MGVARGTCSRGLTGGIPSQLRVDCPWSQPGYGAMTTSQLGPVLAPRARLTSQLPELGRNGGSGLNSRALMSYGDIDSFVVATFIGITVQNGRDSVSVDWSQPLGATIDMSQLDRPVGDVSTSGLMFEWSQRAAGIRSRTGRVHVDGSSCLKQSVSKTVSQRVAKHRWSSLNEESPLSTRPLRRHNLTVEHGHNYEYQGSQRPRDSGLTNGKNSRNPRALLSTVRWRRFWVSTLEFLPIKSQPWNQRVQTPKLFSRQSRDSGTPPREHWQTWFPKSGATVTTPQHYCLGLRNPCGSPVATSAFAGECHSLTKLALRSLVRYGDTF
jgi:hypothetical protein